MPKTWQSPKHPWEPGECIIVSEKLWLYTSITSFLVLCLLNLHRMFRPFKSPTFLRSFLPSFPLSFLPFPFPPSLPPFLPSFLPSLLPPSLPSFLPSLLPPFLASFLPSFLTSFLASFLLPSLIQSLLLLLFYIAPCTWLTQFYFPKRIKAFVLARYVDVTNLVFLLDFLGV